jgi:transcription termination/antitermination protein NusG
MNQEKDAVAEQAIGEDRKWYSLRVISGKEKKIQERILLEVERSEWKDFIFSVIVPTEKVYKIRNGKKVMQERNLLPGYILIEALGTKLNGDVAKLIADIPNVIHFLGKETPLPMTKAEANRLLGKVDESAETGETLSEPFLVGETVKIVDGPFAEFVGDVQEVNDEKKKLKVVVKIFGRGTEVELNFMQVEKIS